MRSSKGFTDSKIQHRETLLKEILDETNTPYGFPNLSIIDISLNGACSRRCNFCPRFDEQRYPNDLSSLDILVYENLINDLSKNSFKGCVTFSGFCEPLLTRNINDYIGIARKNLKRNRIEIISNTDCLPKNDTQLKLFLDKLFESGLTCIIFSLYDGIDQYNILKEKFYTNLNYSDIQIQLRKRYLSDKENFGFTLSNRASAVDIKALGAQYKGPKELPIKAPCYYPFLKVLIDYNGDVLICSHDWHKDKIVGNIKKNGIYEIWTNDSFMEIRRMLSNSERNCFPCSKCDVEGILYGDDHFNNWQKYL